MGNARLVDARHRFNGRYFNPCTEYLEHAICIGDYSCPECGFVVRFNTNDLHREVTSPFTAEQLETANRIRPLIKHEWEQAFDFLCPNCMLAVRVIARPRSAVAMCVYDWVFIHVVEIPA
jgi:hypothetical protein